MQPQIKATKSKKCDYCDDFADYKVKKEGLYAYLCNYCYNNFDKVKKIIALKSELFLGFLRSKIYSI